MQVISRHQDVLVALSSPELIVSLSGQPTGQAHQLRALMARFSDGEDHARRRDLVEALAETQSSLVRTLGFRNEEQVAAAVGVLFQAGDATAALIGSTPPDPMPAPAP